LNPDQAECILRREAAEGHGGGKRVRSFKHRATRIIVRFRCFPAALELERHVTASLLNVKCSESHREYSSDERDGIQSKGNQEWGDVEYLVKVLQKLF
jgi:hypothetical protein